MTTTGLSPAWVAATRGDDGLMDAAEPFRFEPADWRSVPMVLEAVMTAALTEARTWNAEMDVTINPEPDPGTPLDFIAVDIDGRRPWHACNATFMAPSGDVADEANAVLRTEAWQGVGTGGPVYKVWDDVALGDVAAQIATAALAVFPPEKHRFWELSVTVLEPEDDRGTSYEVAASATGPVLQRAVLARLGAPTATSDETAWNRACHELGFDPADVARVAHVPSPEDHDSPTGT